MIYSKRNSELCSQVVKRIWRALPWASRRRKLEWQIAGKKFQASAPHFRHHPLHWALRRSRLKAVLRTWWTPRSKRAKQTQLGRAGTPPCKTKPIRRTRRDTRHPLPLGGEWSGHRAKQSQFAGAFGCGEPLVSNKPNWHTPGSLLHAVREESHARRGGLCVRTNKANWVRRKAALVQNKANCWGAQVGDNCLNHKTLRWFWPAYSRWRTKPICRGRRGARHPVSPGREPRCRRTKQSQWSGSHRAKQSQFAGMARFAVACLPGGGRRTHGASHLHASGGVL
jgi:hypothetical protein